MLATDVPYLEVNVRQVDGGDILADSRDGVELWVQVWAEEGLDLLEQCCLSGVVESKKENGILFGSRQPKSNRDSFGVFVVPSLLVACR